MATDYVRGVKRQRPDYNVNVDANSQAATRLVNLLASKHGISTDALRPLKLFSSAKFNRIYSRGSQRSCWLCSDRVYKLSQSSNVLLTLAPAREALLCDEMYLVPLKHVNTLAMLDDGVYTEIRNYQKMLVKLFYDMGKAVVFVEMYTKSKDATKSHGNHGSHNSRHAKLMVYAIPEDRLPDAKIHTKAAMEQIISDWSEHRKIYKVTGKTGVRGIIPEGFSFLHFDFSLQEGMACVLEDDGRGLDRLFLRKVIAGIMDKDPLERAFKSPQEHSAALSWMAKHYSNYDWTRAG